MRPRLVTLDVSAMLINYLFDDTDSFLLEEVNTDYVRDFKFPVAEMIQRFSLTVQAATSSLKCRRRSGSFLCLVAGSFERRDNSMDELDTHDDVPKANAPDAASERSVNESSVFRHLTRRRVGRVHLTRSRSGRPNRFTTRRNSSTQTKRLPVEEPCSRTSPCQTPSQHTA